MRDRLQANIARNGLDAPVSVQDGAIADWPGASVLHVPGNGNLGQGRIGVASPHKGASLGVRVAVRPLADCLADAGVGHGDLLKVDVEGPEDRVIVPPLDAPDAPRPGLIYFEVARDRIWALPLMERLEACGYRLVRRFRDNSLSAHGAGGGCMKLAFLTMVWRDYWLLAFYDRVVCSDAAEFLVVLDPQKALVGHRADRDEDGLAALAPLGPNMMPVAASDAPSGDAPILDAFPRRCSARATANRASSRNRSATRSAGAG